MEEAINGRLSSIKSLFITIDKPIQVECSEVFRYQKIEVFSSLRNCGAASMGKHLRSKGQLAPRCS